ncbi:MAG: tetratricopeptide repeat protein, partial [Kineosporiaceae bacterium]
MQGCLAFGGLGWIYLATDRNVSDRWVVLKGLLNSGDPDALAAAIAERQFLAQVEHPLIVEIYNFVSHDGAGYIVMEYVGGTSLKSLLKDRMRKTGRYDPFPLDTAIAFILEILPAFGYLHDLGLVYCDFKPDNIIQVGDAVKLIDLGGVRRIDDVDSAIYGTVGYQAPEVAEVGPSVASDLYTIGRTLLVLAAEVRGNQTTYATTLPPAAEIPLLAQQDSLYRLLLKCCAPDPADRFASADELRVQLLGVLREIVAEKEAAAGRRTLHSASSLLFDPPAVIDSSLGWEDLPALRVDESDPMANWLRTVSVADPAQRLAALDKAPQLTAEVRLARARAALQAGAFAVADADTSWLLDDDPWEWRAVWIQGLAALARGDAPAAQAAFNAVYGQVPGELAPKLALALACELTGQDDVA